MEGEDNVVAPEGDSIQVDAGASASSDVRTRGVQQQDVVARAAEDASEDVVNMGTHMDVDGYVPLAFVGSFQAVYSVHQDYESLLEAMKHSETVELDEQNEKIVSVKDGKSGSGPMPREDTVCRDTLTCGG
ncbi:Winged helix-turn-helix DNA-binding domain [Phytophthora cactorum]|nr:Winged helix-turn-helix DNA-binding domain [Phytophthora cactorum]